MACTEMAIAMQRRMRGLQTEWRDLGVAKPFQVRIGISTGYCTVGNFGSEDRMDYTIIGNPANMAARLQNLAAPGEIMMTFESYSLVKDRFVAEEQESVIVKGLAKPVRVFRLAGGFEDSRESGRVVQETRQGLSIHLDMDLISSTDKEAAVEILRRALALLKH